MNHRLWSIGYMQTLFLPAKRHFSKRHLGMKHVLLMSLWQAHKIIGNCIAEKFNSPQDLLPQENFNFDSFTAPLNDLELTSHAI